MAPWGLAHENRSVCISGAGQGPVGTISQPLGRVLDEVEGRSRVLQSPLSPCSPPQASPTPPPSLYNLCTLTSSLYSIPRPPVIPP